MQIKWQEIYNNSGTESLSYFEATYRAEVFGGWLLRHETCFDYQYGCTGSCEDNPSHRHIDEEGWQNVSNTITFIADPKHEWGTNPMDGAI